MWTYSKPPSSTSEEGESIFSGGRAVEYHAIETGLIQDDEEDATCEESGDEADGNEGYDGEDSDGVSGTGDDGGEGELVRATTIDYGVALSANTVDALFGSDSEDNETPDLSRNAARLPTAAIRSGSGPIFWR
ncbi:hypothetical protein GN958_ATG08202 [Phytophthora infestans]|uniref:Uncharacterized protein n=1 Tax=Phytophthora infestans TaxID=4787 RepID=A0A8S9UP71_PHYIN|nr:hypothetical protein GN958_ATG08202 [Phytophthora infestans]